MLSLLLALVWDPTALVPYAKVTYPPLNEISGIVRSRRFPNTYWVHNDSGDSARFFAIHEDGSVIVPAGLDAPTYRGIAIPNAQNVDWEDIARDGANLYLCDTGNNGNSRRDLGVYVVVEPDPFVATEARRLRWIPIAYPDQTEFPPKVPLFDCEAVFVVKGRLHFITKHRTAIGAPARSAALYRLDKEESGKVNILHKLDERADLGGWVTGADVSPDGKTLAVLTQSPMQSVWLFPTAAADGRMLNAPARRLIFTGGRQCEGIGFADNGTLIVTNEQRNLFRLKVADFQPTP